MAHHQGLLAVAAVILLVLPLAYGQTAVPTGTACKSPRVRKPWEALSATEKSTYLEALGLAMKAGYHQKFVELHTEARSEMDAHQQCMFIYWHRMYLLGYENMLRSFGTKYQCVTIPYWDHLAATAKRASGACNSLATCSQIYQDLGGSVTGKQTSLNIYGTTIPVPSGGTCATTPTTVFSNFCANNTVCAKCVIRGPAHRTAYPAEAYFSSVYQQVFTYSDWTRFEQAIERGVHNTVHSALGGIMAYFQSPIDPVFFSHHAFIDLLPTIYNKCQNKGEIFMTKAQKLDKKFWTNCTRRAGGTYSATSSITMNTRNYGGAFVNVRTNSKNILYPFFKDLLGTFLAYVDAKDLGVYSYTYQMSGAVANMYQNCAASNTMKAAVLMANDQDEDQTNNAHGWSLLRPVIRASNAFDDKMRHWAIAIYESAVIGGYTEKAARDQMEMILCVHKDECLGGVTDYSEIFRRNFKVQGHPRCYTILDEIKKGNRIIGVPHWREISSKFLPCDSPTKPNEPAVVDRMSLA